MTDGQKLILCIFITFSVMTSVIVVTELKKPGDPDDQQVKKPGIENYVVDAGLSEDERKIDAILRNFIADQILDMLNDIPATDHRPETEKNWDLLYKARKRLVQPNLSKSDAVNKKLRGL